jgi:hypothetical protein
MITLVDGDHLLRNVKVNEDHLKKYSITFAEINSEG